MLKIETLPADITARLRRNRLARQARAIRANRVELATRIIWATVLALVIATATIVFVEVAVQAITGQSGVTQLTYDAFMRQL